MRKVLNELIVDEIKTDIKYILCNHEHDELLDFMREYIAEDMHDIVYYKMMIAIQDGVSNVYIKFNRSSSISMYANRIIQYGKAYFINTNTYWQLWNKVLEEYAGELNSAYNKFGYTIVFDKLSTDIHINENGIITTFPSELKINIIKE